MLEKHPPYRNKRLRDTRGEACQICGIRDETVVGAHYQGMYAERAAWLLSLVVERLNRILPEMIP